MAEHTYQVADLRTVAEAVLFGPRNVRLDALNAFRDKDGGDPVEYVVNADTMEPADIDTAMTALDSEGATAALESADLVTVFTAALTKDRRYRLAVVNLFGDDDVEYLVNAKQPTPEAVADALEGVADAS